MNTKLISDNILNTIDEYKIMFEPEESFLKTNQLKLDISYMINPLNRKSFINRKELEQIAPEVVKMNRRLLAGEGDCLDGKTKMLGWLSLPEEITTEHLDEIMTTAGELSSKIDAFISLGIGGSYLGIEATIKALSHTYRNEITKDNDTSIYFMGQNMDPDFITDTLDVIKDKRIGLNVISKSGTTTETAIAFRILRFLLEDRFGDKANDLIIATTDKARGALRTLTEQKGYKSFIVPDNVGGRFSVLTDVGLFGLAMAGINIYEFVAGFRNMKHICDSDNFWSNPAMVHAAIRHLAYKKGKKVEVVATNSNAIYQLTRWMEQLFPESEGHKGYGLWVSPSMYSEKLHANGQMVQDGERNIIETFIRLGEFNNRVEIPSDDDNLDGLNYLSDSGKDVNFINDLVIDGPAYAHFKGGTPNMTLTIPRRNAFNIGQFYYMMEKSVALSGYLAGHNPFIQPGVEAYKKAMFALAGKPGSENEGAKMRAELENMDRTVIG
ncbi:MAG: glucose-6-phosphate isomerase [Candidatus Zixiibacteriota bacterium]